MTAVDTKAVEPQNPVAAEAQKPAKKNTVLPQACFEIKEYRSPMAIVTVDIMRPNGRGFIKWAYTLMFSVDGKSDLSGEGDIACGSAEAAILTAEKRAIPQWPEVEIGGTVETPYGKFEVNWYNRGFRSYVNHDHLLLKKVE